MCASLGPFLRSLVESFRVGLSKSVNETFRTGYIGSKLHANPTLDGITPLFLEGIVLEDNDSSNKGEDVFDTPADTEVIKL